MATLQSVNNRKVFQVNKFLGINQSQNGDTTLKMGEAADMRNFKITNDYRLQKRPGTKNIANLLQTYTTGVAGSATTVSTKLNASTASFTCYPNISVGNDGLFELSGTNAAVTQSNIGSYANYYWRDASGNVWKLGTCVFTEGTTGGTDVIGGSVAVGTPVQTGTIPVTTAYPGIKVENGAVVVTGSVATISSVATAINAGTPYYYIYQNQCYKLTTVPSFGFDMPSYYTITTITYAADDKYEWKFYAVTATTNETDIQVRAIWSGIIDDIERLVAASNGKLWNITCTNDVWAKTELGTIDTTATVHMFDFGGKLYVMDGTDYYSWDGTNFATVTGYRPLTAVTVPYSGGGTAVQEINKLNGLRRVQFSPDGNASHNVFQLPETSLTSIDYVKNTVSGKNYTVTTDYSVNTTLGQVTLVTSTKTENKTGNGTAKSFTLTNNNVYSMAITVDGSPTTAFSFVPFTNTVVFDAAPANGKAIVITETTYPGSSVNTVEIGYTVSTTYRSDVVAMTFSELFNGATDTRVFLYGDGTNQAFYSAPEYETGAASAEYFPDLNVLDIGNSNTPITAMIRHYDRLISFKLDGAYSTAYGDITTATNTVIAGFYTSPINKEIGNVPLGQVRLARNNPRTIFGKTVYEWATSATTIRDERNADRIGQKIEDTIANLTIANLKTYDDERNQEYYIFGSGDTDDTVIVNNYSNGTWYVYTNIPATCMANFGGVLYIGTDTGYVREFSRDYMNDIGEAIDCYWESGSMDFGAPYMKKTSRQVWPTLNPEIASEIEITAQSNRKSLHPVKTFSGVADFTETDFSEMAFGVNYKPQTARRKLKVKKYSHYKLIMQSNTANTRATVLNVNIPVLYTGMVRR